MPDRAGRLGATMLLLGIVREPAEAAVQGAAESPCLTTDEWEAWRETDDEDFRLAHACLNVEFEHRARQFDALERYGTAFAAGTGDSYAERVASMPAAEARTVLLAAFHLGGHHLIGGKTDDGRWAPHRCPRRAAVPYGRVRAARRVRYRTRRRRALPPARSAPPDARSQTAPHRRPGDG